MAKKSLLRRVLLGIGAFVGLIVVLMGAITYSAFAGNTPIVDGQVVVPGIRVIKDGIVGVGFIDIGYEHIALVDCGNDPKAKAILDALARQSRTADSVRMIFLTHGHSDHTNGCAMFPKATLVALKNEVDVVAGREGGHGPITRFMPYKPTGLTVGHPASDGERIDIGTRHVTVYAVPGHTDGSAAFLVDGALFLGDSARTGSDLTLRGSPWAFSNDGSLNIASLHALGARLKATRETLTALIPAHTGVLANTDLADALMNAH